MKIYINPNNLQIEKRKTSSIEYDIQDELILSKYIDSDSKISNIHEDIETENNEFLINDSQYNIIKDDDITSNNIDEIILYGKFAKHIDYENDKQRTSLVPINNENYNKLIGMSIDDLLELNYQNILNDSEYDFILFDLLKNIIIDESNFSFCNRLNFLLYPKQNLKIKINNTSDSIDDIYISNMNNKDILFNNIPKDIDIYINNMDINNITEINFFGNIIIDFVNNTNKPKIVTDPYILIKGSLNNK